MTHVNNFLYSAKVPENRDGGFDEEEFVSKALEIPVLKEQMGAMGAAGYCYAGDTAKTDNPHSKAYTDLGTKKIYIKKEKTVDEALLSLMYELTNAKNTKKLETIYKGHCGHKWPSRSGADSYARAVLGVEADAAYYRASVAISLDREDLIKNPKHVAIVKEHDGHRKLATQALREEMITNGMVHNGAKKAVTHYAEQYWEEHIS